MIQQEAPDFTADAVIPKPSPSTSASPNTTPSKKAGKEDAGEISKITLSNYRNQKWVLLLFYPLNFTFVCPTEIYAFSDRNSEFEALDCQVLAVSCDSAFAHLAWANMERDKGGLGIMNIPLVSDFDKSIARAYGVLLPDGVPLRALFLISPEGIVRQMTVNDLSVGRSVDESIRLLQAFQFTDKYGEVCPANWKPGASTMVADPIRSREFFRHVANPTRSVQGIEGLLGWYMDSVKTSPLRTKAITSCVIGVVGEVLGALVKSSGSSDWSVFWSNSYDRLDTRRMACFGTFGLVVSGPFFHWWYGYLESLMSIIKRIGADDLSGEISLIIKLAINQLVMTPPFLLFTLVYIQYFLTLDFKRTLSTIKKTFAAALFTNWKVWTVAQAFNFLVVPLDYRVLFGNGVALWWNIYLSLVSNNQ